MVLQNGAIPTTLLMLKRGKEISEAIANLDKGGFGILAGTGAGKTVAIRHITEKILGQDLRVDIITREYQATDYTWTCDVLVITPGVALHWIKSGTVNSKDLIVIDEIHQTSDHLELAMALAKRAGCTFVWMSATIDPIVYAQYLNVQQVISCSAFDPKRRSRVTCSDMRLEHFLDEDKIKEIFDQRRAVAVFVPTRAKAENLAKYYSEIDGLYADFYHGGESAEKLQVFLKGEVPKPFMIFMTNAGASSLNILGLDTVVIIDEMFTDVVRSGVKVFERVHLGNNELLQMGGRVNGRAENSQIHILTSLEIDFHALKPTTPQFLVGGDLERVALTCARLGIDASELDLIVQIIRAKYEKVVERFRARGVIELEGNGLTLYGKEVERLPTTPAWAEMLVKVQEEQNQQLLHTTVVCACVESLFGLIYQDCSLKDLEVAGSDHLTCYNIVAKALGLFGYIDKDGKREYHFQGDNVSGDYWAHSRKGAFPLWCQEHGFKVKAIREVTLAMKSVYRQLGMELPGVEWFETIKAGDILHRQFLELLARVQSFDFVLHERHDQAGTVFPGEHSRTKGADRILGTIRWRKDRKDYERASIEGTVIPETLVKKYASRKLDRFVGMSTDGERMIAQYQRSFAGQTLAPLTGNLSEKEIPEDQRTQAAANFRRWLAAQMS